MPHNNPSFSLVFVCQAGDLELMSCILAASIREHYPEMKLIAGIPQPEEIFGTVADETIEFLKGLHVEIQYFTNSLIETDPSKRKKHHYFVNKIFLLKGVTIETDKVVFIDSDFILIEPFKHYKWLYAPINLRKTCDYSAIYLDGEHKSIYSALGQLPSTQIEVYYDPRTSKYLIQNQDVAACFLSIDSAIKNIFCETWIKNYNTLIKKSACNPHFYEQAALLPTARLLNISYSLITPYETGFKHSDRMSDYKKYDYLKNTLLHITKKYPYIYTLAKNNSAMGDIL